MAMQITSANFNEAVVHSELPVLVDFWATWCGPCRMLGPVIEEIAAEQAGKVVVGKVNVDDEPFLAAQFHVTNIPTVIVLKNGKEVARSVGLVPKQRLLDLL